MGNIIVLGLGNILRGDEGVGVHALGALRDGYRFPRNVMLVDGGTVGLRLLELVGRADQLLVLDAVAAGAEPGSLFRFPSDQLQSAALSVPPHETGLPEILAFLEAIEGGRPETVIIGVQPESVSAWNLDLSVAVGAVLPQLIDLVLEQLARWEAPAESRAGDLRSLT